MPEKTQPASNDDRSSSNNSRSKGIDQKADYFQRVSSESTTGSEEVDPLKKSFGIRKAELQTKQYDTRLLKGIYFFTIFICMYINTIEGNALDVFVGYATESFKQHSLMSTIGIIRRVIAAASLPAYARLSDIFGRLELFAISLIFRVVGLIVMSQATDINRYAGGMVIYSIGTSGARILWQINLSDASTLKNRMLAICILNLPSIINTWASGPIVDSLIERHDWKFGIALWAFTFPLVVSPYMLCALHMRIKAGRTDEWMEITNEENDYAISKSNRVSRYEELRKSGSTGFMFNIKRYSSYIGFWFYETIWRVDFIACLLIIAIFGFILVPLTLAGGTSLKWAEAQTIAPLVIGFCLIPVFIVWEMKLARSPLIPFPLLKDRGIWAAFTMGVLYTFAGGMPNSYAYPVLHVGMNASRVVATRTPLLLHFVWALTMPVVGFVVSKVRRTKMFILFGVMIWFVAMGVFLHFRGDNDGLRGKYYRDGVAVGFVLLGLGQGFFTRLVSISAQTCTNHEYMASVTALFAAIYQLGGAFGRCVTGAIWTQTMYHNIRQNMIDRGVDPSLAEKAYEAPYKFIKEYTWGTTPRIAVVLAYADVQRKLCIAGLCICVAALINALFLRDHRLANAQSLEDTDEEQALAKQENKGKIVFTNDDDPIFRFIRMCWKKVTPQLS